MLVIKEEFQSKILFNQFVCNDKINLCKVMKTAKEDRQLNEMFAISHIGEVL